MYILLIQNDIKQQNEIKKYQNNVINKTNNFSVRNFFVNNNKPINTNEAIVLNLKRKITDYFTPKKDTLNKRIKHTTAPSNKKIPV